MFKLIQLLELVLSLLEFSNKLVEFGSSGNRWRFCSGRDVCYTRVDFCVKKFRSNVKSNVKLN